MDLYTSERLFIERHRRMVEEAERRALLARQGYSPTVRLWAADHLRLLADRLERSSRLQRSA